MESAADIWVNPVALTLIDSNFSANLAELVFARKFVFSGVCGFVVKLSFLQGTGVTLMRVFLCIRVMALFRIISIGRAMETVGCI